MALPASRHESARTPQAAPPEIKPPGWSRKATRYGLLASLLCLLTSGLLWLRESGPPPTPVQAAVNTAPGALPLNGNPAAQAGPVRVTKPIEQLRLGDWVLAKNPQLDQAEAAAEVAIERPEDYRALSLRLRKADDTLLHLELLRTAEWVKENERLGKIYVHLEELGIDGWADFLAIRPCPEIADRPHADCRLVTGRFIHQAGNAFDLTVTDAEGDERTQIGVTGNHPVWSEDRQDFVRVDSLAIGENLRDTQGRTLKVGSIEPRAGPEQVHNLEVDVEHVYYVSSAGVLVHNGTTRQYNGELDSDASRTSPSPYSTRIDPKIPGRPDPRFSIDTIKFSAGEITSKGGIRNTKEFWQQWLQLQPESLSASNRFLIENYDNLKVSPRIDDEWIKAFPEHAPFKGDVIIHHHVDFGRYAIPVPGMTHVGSGGIWHTQ